MWIIWPFRKKNFGAAWNICADFRRFSEADTGKFIIRDEKRLPHPKEQIFESMCILLMTETDQALLERIRGSAFELAFFQKDVGAQPLHPLGIDRDMFELEGAGADELPSFAAANALVANPAGKERYDRFKSVRDADWKRMQATMTRVQRRAAS